MPNQDITDKQEAFCQAYVRCWNATAAAARAGYANPASAGSSLLADPRISERIFQLGQDRYSEGPATKLVRKRLEAALVTLTYSQITDYLSWDSIRASAGQPHIDEKGNSHYSCWQLKPSHALTPQERFALKSVQIRPTQYGTTVKVELKDPGVLQTALDYLSLGGDDIETFCRSILDGPGIFAEVPEVPSLVGEVGGEE